MFLVRGDYRLYIYIGKRLLLVAVSCELRALLMNRDKRWVWCRRLRDSDETNDKCYVPRNHLSSCVYIYAMCLCNVYSSILRHCCAFYCCKRHHSCVRNQLEVAISTPGVWIKVVIKAPSCLYIPPGSSSQ